MGIAHSLAIPGKFINVVVHISQIHGLKESAFGISSTWHFSNFSNFHQITEGEV